MLDQRPIPRYLVGFPTEIQEVILRTVESQLKDMTKGGVISQEIAEDLTEIELKELKPLCKGIINMSYQPNLVVYIAALKAARDQQ